jgi:hypothetical protein
VPSNETHRKNRQRLRKQLRKQGLTEAQIDAILANKRERQHETRIEARGREVEQARIERETYRRLNPDDRSFRPSSPDPLTMGPARVSGTVAKVVKRRTAVTKWEHDQLEGK